MARLQVVIGLLVAVLVFVAGGSDVARADPDNVQAGHDLLETAGETYIDFSDDPLPADFFGPGSDPFDGIIYLEGNPFDSFGGYNGLWPTDTIVERKEEAGIPEFPDTIDIEIVALELKSVEPITVTYNGGMDPELWEMTAQVPEGDLNQTTGSMTIRHEFPDGGTFDSSLPVNPLLTFTEVGGPGIVGPTYLSYLVGGPIVFEVDVADNVPWCHTANPLDVPPGQVVIEKPGLTSNFFPGIICPDSPGGDGQRIKGLVVLDAPFPARHSVRSAENPAPPVGDIQSGHDLLETDSSDTYLDLYLAAGFFGPGSDPFDGRVYLQGVPFDSFGDYDGLSPTDAIVERLQDAGPGFPDTIDIEIVALELKSVEPITVTGEGEYPQIWELTVSVPEGDTEQETGSMTIRHEDPEGGTFDTALPVRPLLTFTQVDGPGAMEPFYFPDPLDPALLVFEAYDAPWCHTANPLDDPPGHVVIEKPGLTTNFFPSIACGSPRTKAFFAVYDEWQASYFARHSVRSAEKLSPVGGIAALPDVSDSSGRSYVALAALAAAGLVALTAGTWYARRRWLG